MLSKLASACLLSSSSALALPCIMLHSALYCNLQASPNVPCCFLPLDLHTCFPSDPLGVFPGVSLENPYSIENIYSKPPPL